MKYSPSQRLRIVVLVHEDAVPPSTLADLSAREALDIKTEFDVVKTLKAMGHDVHVVGVYDQLQVINTALREHHPHVVFNIVEEFQGYPLFDQHVVSYLELLKQPYTGCNPRGLTLAHDKALTKMVLTYHRIPVPRFAVFPMNHKVRHSGRLPFPLLVKSVSEDGSVGIAQASIVHDNEKLAERVEFIHRQNNTDAIAEQYIKGREIYVGVFGNVRIQTLPPWELIMENLPEGDENIATLKVKWDPAYQKKVGLVTKAAELTPEQHSALERLSKRIYRALFLSGYARLDFRMTDDGKFYLLEANPNPMIARGEEFAESAAHAGIAYEQLLQKLLMLGMKYRAVNNAESLPK